MAFTLIAHAAAGNITTATTPAVDTTGSDLIAAIIGDFGGATPSRITDNKGNTWFLAGYTGITNPTLTAFLCYPTSVGAGHTFSTAGANVPAIAIQAWSGSNKQLGSKLVTAVTSFQPGTIVNPQSTGLLICGMVINVITTLSIDDGFTISDQVQVVAANHEGIGMAYNITGAGTHSPTWSWAGASDVAGILLSIEGVGSSGGGGGGAFVF